MRDTILIINGVNSEKDLEELGLYIAKKYSSAEFVVVINDRGNARFMKKLNNPEFELEYIDVRDYRGKTRG
jgi:hypoxanthine-guanine phosphoribosyltransferase